MVLPFSFDLVLLSFLVYIVGRDSADFEISNLFFVLIGIGIGSAAIGFFLLPVIGLWATAVMALFAVFMIMRYVCLSFGQVLIVAALFVVARLLIVVL